ncbi:aldehyde-activating protein [Izhakiella australiensis]|uniref:Aldehyde-activating protein n=1 Tax=Izhakiella australiensis TaxID=1926881 RepID=A0A1S8YMI5_9GAMM|nr:GFA family protein [Izhakiella australiensis]OON40260.1 aldehyde-activating protein [Izhakiella australiensis]
MPDNMSAQCHCGAVTFDVELIEGLNGALRCNCSLCRMRGAVVLSARRIKVTAGSDKLTEYRFNSKEVAHYFCALCGIYTFHQRRSNPELYGVNAACLEGISPFDFASVKVIDGNNHPKDGGAGGVAGYLSYTAK